MSIYVDVDKILKALSTKFHKIFYDREFVCCVQEDFQVILKNRNRCCVVVFPVLGLNYLKAVQYQAKIFDLEVFTLGSGKICSLAVCDKKFLIKQLEDSEEQIMQSNEQEYGAGSTLKKKRPERQLYIPPAQRRLPVTELPVQNNPKADHGSSSKGRKHIATSSRKKEPPKQEKNISETPNVDSESSVCSEDLIKDAIINIIDKIRDVSYMWWKYELFEPTSSNGFKSVSTKSFMNKNILCNISPDGSKLFGLENGRTLYILSNDYFLWQPKVDMFVNSKESTLKVVPLINFDQSDVKGIDVCERAALTESDFVRKTYLEILEDFSIYCDVDVFWIRNNVKPRNLLNVCCSDIYYIKDDCCDGSRSIEELINDLLLAEDGNTENESEIVQIEHLEKKVPHDTNREKTEEVNNKPIENKTEVPLENDSHLQKNNLKNNIPNSNFNYLKNTINRSENVKVKNYLEEEKEIMRKAKENINRKTRPIIRYVDDANDTLKIDKNDVNNWEDLFDEEGRLQDDLLKEIVHKVGNDVTIVKAKEDYSEYFTKHVNIEELEHMVELYDFPPTLETHDLIHAFSEVKSDAMYVKWVDDTHAILVLGSSSQAQKAINVQNPLIKVRPMTAACKTSLSTAYRNDLKPAMKRPATNLQTARRLITNHLGTKSGVSKERSAKERDDLKAAREMKKLVKKNEQDAWDGNLRSTMN